MNLNCMYGEKLRQIRREVLGLSQEDVAEMMGISVDAYARLERGETNITIKRLEQFCDACNVSRAYLLHPEFWSKEDIEKNVDPLTLIETGVSMLRERKIK